MYSVMMASSIRKWKTVEPCSVNISIRWLMLLKKTNNLFIRVLLSIKWLIPIKKINRRSIRISLSNSHLMLFKMTNSWFIRILLSIRTIRAINTCFRTRTFSILVKLHRLWNRVKHWKKKRENLGKDWENVSLSKIYSVWIRIQLDMSLLTFQTMK